MKKQGEIEVLKQKDNRYVVLLGGEWFSGFGSAPEGIEKGDLVEIEYEEKNGFKNIKKIEKVEKEVEKPEKEKRINKYVALKTAVEFAKIEQMKPLSASEVLQVAEMFRKWLEE